MRVTLQDITREAPNIYTFRLQTDKPLTYTPGQFIELYIGHKPKDSRGTKRWFTVSSAPEEDYIAITTKITENSSTFKQALRSLEPGAKLIMARPIGDFVLPKATDKEIILVAGGIGSTPFRSMVQHRALVGSDGPAIKVIYAANTLDEVAFTDTFTALGAENFIKVPVTAPKGWSGPSGRIDAQMVLAQTKDPARALFYLSGPPPMVKGIKQELIKNGVASKAIKTDYFPGYTAL